jgi:hypothetical protein
MANVFVSYRKSDSQKAESLAMEIRNAGHQVWLDKWNITTGDSIIERINSGLAGASYVIICYSYSRIDSPWMGREWMSSLARQLDGCGVKVLPVMLTGGEPPSILADLRYADLVNNWSQGMSELLQAIK